LWILVWEEDLGGIKFGKLVQKISKPSFSRGLQTEDKPRKPLPFCGVFGIIRLEVMLDDDQE